MSTKGSRVQEVQEFKVLAPKSEMLLLAKTKIKMKKFIFILDVLKIMAGLKMGKRIEGVLYLDQNTGKLTFKAYNRQSRTRQKDKLLCYLEHGWVKESAQRIKVFESLPKRIGAARMIDTLERETVEAANEIAERELFENGF